MGGEKNPSSVRAVIPATGKAILISLRVLEDAFNWQLDFQLLFFLIKKVSTRCAKSKSKSKSPPARLCWPRYQQVAVTGEPACWKVETKEGPHDGVRDRSGLTDCSPCPASEMGFLEVPKDQTPLWLAKPTPKLGDPKVPVA